MAAKSAASARKPASRSTPERKRFALSSPSRPLDHRLNAARRDLADISLAGRWFAPHYAVPELRAGALGGADILSGPSAASQRISQLLPGEAFAVVEDSGDWAWGYSAHDRYVGYVLRDRLAVAADATHRVVAPKALVFAEPASRAGLKAEVPMGATLTGEVEGGFLRIAEGFVPMQQLKPIGDLSADAVTAAEQLVGTPYLWGGRGIGGIDCSGLVQLSYGMAGIALARDSDQQKMEGAEVNRDVRRGDLLFFPDHVVLLSGPETAIHASGQWMSTVIEPLADIVARLGPPTARRRVAT